MSEPSGTTDNSIRKYLSHKSILVFCVKTFGYESDICAKLSEYAKTVTYYDERPLDSNFHKGLIRLKRNLYQGSIDKYYLNILEKHKNKVVDLLFVIRGEVVPEFFLQQFKEQHPDCKFVFYTWDSFQNHEHPKKIIKYFDRKLTFDPRDAKEFDLQLRPLFYSKVAPINIKSKSASSIDILFIGTAHSDRYQITDIVDKWCVKNGKSTYFYYFQHGLFVYLFKRLFESNFGRVPLKKLKFRSLSKEDIDKLVEKSDTVLDIQHPGQLGLTMRVFESLGAKKKLITTNKDILKYKFCNESIMVVDREDIQVSLPFLDREFTEIEPHYFDAMSIDSWLHDVFVGCKFGYWIDDV